MPPANHPLLEQRRLQAALRFSQGASTAQVANEFGVSRNAAYKWHCLWKLGNAQALLSTRPPGNPKFPPDYLEMRLGDLWESQAWPNMRQFQSAVLQKLQISYSVSHLGRLITRFGIIQRRPRGRPSKHF